MILSLITLCLGQSSGNSTGSMILLHYFKVLNYGGLVPTLKTLGSAECLNIVATRVTILGVVLPRALLFGTSLFLCAWISWGWYFPYYSSSDLPSLLFPLVLLKCIDLNNKMGDLYSCFPLSPQSIKLLLLKNP